MAERRVVKRDEAGHDITQVPLTTEHAMIETLGASRLDAPFRDGVR